ncbi:MAG: FIG01000339: hypothetical protein, partial [uncultured Nocardioidaceae bacterium]
GFPVHRRAPPHDRCTCRAGLPPDRRLPPVDPVVPVGGRGPGPAPLLHRGRVRRGRGLRVVRQPEGRGGADGDPAGRAELPDRGGPHVREAVQVQEHRHVRPPAGRGAHRGHLADDRPAAARHAAHPEVLRHGQAHRQGLRQRSGPDGADRARATRL